MVIEIVDAEERIRTFLAAIESMMTGGLITLEKAQVVRYGGEEEVS
jgi:PII-like signaling protein